MLLNRRAFLERAALGTLSASVIVRKGAAAPQSVPNSTGNAAPKLQAPLNASDCHMHVYDAARFPMPSSQRVPPTNATAADYRLLQRRIGTTRVVVVTPRNYATENAVTLDAIEQLGANARGVAVVHPRVTS